MKEAIITEEAAKIKAGKFTFQANGSKIDFEGFLKAYKMEESEIKSNELPRLEHGQKLNLEKLMPDQHFTEAPARFSEGNLIKELEKRGIGRPSTYAPIISTLMDRGYVEKTQGRLLPKDIGLAVNDLLVEHFPEIIGA